MEDNYGNGNAQYGATMYRELMFDPTAGAGLTDEEVEIMLFDTIPLKDSDLVEIVEREPLRIVAEQGPIRKVHYG